MAAVLEEMDEDSAYSIKAPSPVPDPTVFGPDVEAIHTEYPLCMELAITNTLKDTGKVALYQSYLSLSVSCFPQKHTGTHARSNG
jgi:hypothetical protein